jgi:hypothetical protein
MEMSELDNDKPDPPEEATPNHIREVRANSDDDLLPDYKAPEAPQSETEAPGPRADANSVETPEERTARLNEKRPLPEDPRTPDWREHIDDSNRYEKPLPDEYPDADKIRIEPDRDTHILDGDETGGGHRHGTGKSMKSEFPEDWSDDDIRDAAVDVARNPDHVEDEGPNPAARYTATGERDGVPMRVAVREDGEIWTAYPAHKDWPRNQPPEEDA